MKWVVKLVLLQGQIKQGLKKKRSTQVSEISFIRSLVVWVHWMQYMDNIRWKHRCFMLHTSQNFLVADLCFPLRLPRPTCSRYYSCFHLSFCMAQTTYGWMEKLFVLLSSLSKLLSSGADLDIAIFRLCTKQVHTLKSRQDHMSRQFDVALIHADQLWPGS